MTTSSPTRSADTTTPRFDRALTPAELDAVLAAVHETDYEHGLFACLAVEELVAIDLGFASAAEMTEQLADKPVFVAVPLAQWLRVARKVEAEASRHGGGEAAVLADWVAFGPRISAAT